MALKRTESTRTGVFLVAIAAFIVLLSNISLYSNYAGTTFSPDITKEATMTPPFYKRILGNPSYTAPRQIQSVPILFGLFGNNPSFLAEFEVALKSVLLNAPLKSDLSIHIMADGDAYDALGLIFYRTGLNGTMWRNSISIQTYNVDPYLEDWTNETRYMNLDRNRHTRGTYFRLYAHRVLPNNIEHVLYMDTDVVIMANLDSLWENVDRNSAFQWGDDGCAGFLVLNVQKLDEIWDMARRCDLANISNVTGHDFNDQLIFLAVNRTFPNVVALLPGEWAISVANGAWRHAGDIVDYRPKVGMFHFNGGGSDNTEYWKGDFVKGFADTWGWSLLLCPTSMVLDTIYWREHER